MSVSCAGFHNPAQSFSNGKAFAQGVSGGYSNRNMPSIVNRLVGRTQSWDGDAETLESQVLGLLLNPGDALTQILRKHSLHLTAEKKPIFLNS